jgi:prefoldin subunit 5
LDSYRDANGHDRTYWQKKIKPLRSRLDELDSQIQSVQRRQAETNVTTGLKVSRKGTLRASSHDSAQALAKKMDDLTRKRSLVVKSIQEVEEEARKAQALPEWLR